MKHQLFYTYIMNSTTGFAKNTSNNQVWLNTTDAITAWIELDDTWIEFQCKEDADISHAPTGIYFDADAISEDEPEVPAITIDFERLRDCLTQRGASTNEVVEWFVAGVDEQDTMRRARYAYDALAEILDRCYRDEQDANADSLAHAKDLSDEL